MSERALQVCDLCGGVDMHPRHVSQTPTAAPSGAVLRAALDAGADDRLLADLNDTSTTVHHLDCGAGVLGCDVCIQSEARTGGLRGYDLDAKLTELNTKEN